MAECIALGAFGGTGGTGVARCGCGSVRGTDHKPLSVRFPRMIIWLFLTMSTLYLSKIAMQSSSQR